MTPRDHQSTVVFSESAWREPFDSRTSQAMEFHQGRLELRHPALGEVGKWCTRYTPNPIGRPFPFNHAMDVWNPRMFHFSKVFSTAFREEIPIGRNPSCRWWEPIVFLPIPSTYGATCHKPESLTKAHPKNQTKQVPKLQLPSGYLLYPGIRSAHARNPLHHLWMVETQ